MRFEASLVIRVVFNGVNALSVRARVCIYVRVRRLCVARVHPDILCVTD